MSNQIEQHGGFAAYLLDNLRSSVANRTVGGELNDRNATIDEVASVFTSNLSRLTLTVLGEAIVYYSVNRM